MTDIRSLPADTRGVTALEYALIAAIIAVVTVGVMHGVGNSLLQNFTIIVEASREAPQPMAVVDTRLPKPPVQGVPQATAQPVPDQDDDESSSLPEAEAEDVADAREPSGPRPGIDPAESALGPWEDGLPATALATPRRLSGAPHAGRGGLNPGAGTTRDFAEAPPGRESSGDGSDAQAETAPAAESPAARIEAPPPPFFNDRQKAALRSAFILFLWAAFAIALANLIWRIVTRKAHEREVEDQLEDWQPATFG